MRFNRQNRFVTALVALFSVLFMQLAVAAYACPSVNTTSNSASELASAGMHDTMEGCDEGDEAHEPALCFAYSQEGSQSLYKPPVPDVQPAVVAMIVRQITADLPDFHSLFTPASVAWLTRASDPPISIRNCCFRI